MKTILLTILLLTLSGQSFGQEPDRWRGLILDESTPEQAIAKLGKPSEPGFMIKTVLKGLRKRGLNVQAFNWDDAEGFRDVNLYFLDGALAVIHLERPKTAISTASFVDAYPDLKFYVVTHGSPLGLSSIRTNSFEAITPKGKISGIAAGGSTYRALGLEGRESIYKPEGSLFAVSIESNRWFKGNSKSIDALK
ncbi:hypothetical protein BH18ACI3_BH18ACI3_20210 [soil metagenome]